MAPGIPEFENSQILPNHPPPEPEFRLGSQAWPLKWNNCLFSLTAPRSLRREARQPEPMTNPRRSCSSADAMAVLGRGRSKPCDARRNRLNADSLMPLALRLNELMSDEYLLPLFSLTAPRSLRREARQPEPMTNPRRSCSSADAMAVLGRGRSKPCDARRNRLNADSLMPLALRLNDSMSYEHLLPLFGFTAPVCNFGTIFVLRGVSAATRLHRGRCSPHTAG